MTCNRPCHHLCSEQLLDDYHLVAAQACFNDNSFPKSVDFNDTVVQDTSTDPLEQLIWRKVRALPGISIF